MHHWPSVYTTDIAYLCKFEPSRAVQKLFVVFSQVSLKLMHFECSNYDYSFLKILNSQFKKIDQIGSKI